MTLTFSSTPEFWIAHGYTIRTLCTKNSLYQRWSVTCHDGTICHTTNDIWTCAHNHWIGDTITKSWTVTLTERDPNA